MNKIWLLILASVVFACQLPPSDNQRHLGSSYPTPTGWGLPTVTNGHYNAAASGGDAGQVPTWSGGVDGGVSWATPSSGGIGAFGVFASRPSCTSVGNTYWSSDFGNAVCDGSAWRPTGPNGVLFTAPSPVPASWTWLNQNGSTLTAYGDTFFLVHRSDASDVGYQTPTVAISGTYTATACFLPSLQVTASGNPGNGVGLAVTDGTGTGAGVLLSTWTVINTNGALSVRAIHLNQFNSIATTQFNVPYPMGLNALVCLRMQDDATKRRNWISFDAGLQWLDVYDENRHTFLTETHVGPTINPGNAGSGPGMTILHWTLTSP